MISQYVFFDWPGPTSNIASGLHERSNISTFGFELNNWKRFVSVSWLLCRGHVLTARTSSRTCFLLPSRTTSCSRGFDMLEEWRWRAFGEPRTSCSGIAAAKSLLTETKRRKERRNNKVLNPYMMNGRVPRLWLLQRGACQSSADQKSCPCGTSELVLATGLWLDVVALDLFDFQKGRLLRLTWCWLVVV